MRHKAGISVGRRFGEEEVTCVLSCGGEPEHLLMLLTSGSAGRRKRGEREERVNSRSEYVESGLNITTCIKLEQRRMKYTEMAHASDTQYLKF